MKKNIIQATNISFCMNVKKAHELARFFFKNVDPSYISHSEMQYGRAVGRNRWSPRLLDLLKKEFAALARSSGAGKDSFRLVQAEADGALVGVAVVEFNNQSIRPFAVIEDLMVSRKLRRAGIGGRMLEWIEAQAVKRKIPELYLESGINNNSAHQFFEKHRFGAVSKVMMKRLRLKI